MTIGEKIKKQRFKLGMTQATLARKVGISPQRIYQYEKGIRVPKIETLIKLANALRCRPEDIADYEHFPFLALPPIVHMLPGDYDHITEEQAEHINNIIKSSDRAALITAKGKINDDLYLLNRSGLDKAVERVHELTEVPRYRNDASSASSPAPEEPEQEQESK